MMGDGNIEAFEVFPPQVHLLLNPLSSGFDCLHSASFNEIVQLSSDPSMAPPEIDQ